MPQTSFPWEPASFLKQEETPQYLKGRSWGSSHSFLCNAEIGYSDVAIK